MQDELAEIRGLEVFDAAELPQYDVAEIARNFTAVENERGECIRPPLVIGHSEDQSILKDSGLPAAGWISSLRAVGTKLIAEVSEVPRLVAEAISRGAYRRVSAELYPDYKGLGQVLRRVALLGGAIPKVKTLQDVIAMYSDDEPYETVSTVVRDEAPPEHENERPDDEGRNIPIEIEDDFGEVPVEVEIVDEGSRREEIAVFCEELKLEGRYAPAWDGLGLPEFMRTLEAGRPVCFAEGAAEQTPLEWFKSFLLKLPAVVKFEEKAAVKGREPNVERDRLIGFYRDHRSQFEKMNVTLDMYLAAEGMQ